jgi:hypothetical protein
VHTEALLRLLLKRFHHHVLLVGGQLKARKSVQAASHIITATATATATATTAATAAAAFTTTFIHY